MRPAHLINAEKNIVAVEFDIFDCAYMHSGSSSKLAAPVSYLDSSLAGAEFAGLTQSPVSVPPEILVTGNIGSDEEQDVYSFEVVEGQTYMLSAYGSGGEPLEDTLLLLADDTLSVIAEDDDGGAGRMSLLTFTAEYTGTYYAAVMAFPGLGVTGEYTLDLLAQPEEDIVPDTFEGAVDLNLNGVTYGFIDGTDPFVYFFAGETDTYKLEVEAGKFYTIEVAGGADHMSDYADLPPGELDPWVFLYNSDGSLITQNDDIGFPTDINSRISFFAEESGTYYLDVQSYYPYTGGYSITSQEMDLSTLDPLESLIWDDAANIDPGDDGIVHVYFAVEGESFGELADNGVDPLPSFGWNAWEKQQVMVVLSEYSKILGFTYEETTDSSEADFRLITTTSEQYGAYFYPQDPTYGDAQGIGAFNVDNGGWLFDQQQGLTQGGFDFGVVLHEFGHAHGLAHPHDTGGGSEILAGVTGSASFGVYDLNQGVYTVMSYNDSWPTGPNGATPLTAANVDSGWSGTLSAFDIAALQERYGIINAHATGNDVYELGDANDPGVYYETIWDTGGTDEIRYSGNRNARIDLLAATIDYSPTGGGVMSYVEDVFGGYTIARHVVIENATGGGGDDVIIGNSTVNVLTGNGGDDVLMGREGGDTLNGGAGFDTASYMDADAGVHASLASRKGTVGDAAGDKYIGIEKLEGSNFADTLDGGNAD
ncbi:pre-peptidase C-terminal domain-containing protein, partial [Sphingosinicella sp. CPCC 101087]|uniref:pre-peptidase C-terminal domain-containing protein n=1 Tax=Sphingosinicella sp. CPCC 101087 TaxID=2497754 RepID=UPI0019805E8E